MKKIVIPFILIITACVWQVPEQGISYSASTVYSLQQFGKTKEFGNISMVYVYPVKPQFDKIKIERLDSSGKFQKVVDTLDVEEPQNINDVDTLTPDTKYFYTMTFIDGGEHPYDTVETRTLPVIEITAPGDTVSGDTITVKWKTIEFEDEKFTEYTVELYKNLFDMENPELPQRLFTLTLTVEGDEGVVEIPWNSNWSRDWFLFTIKISTSRELKYLVDNSISYKGIVWLQESY